jgi:hypothetical protein
LKRLGLALTLTLLAAPAWAQGPGAEGLPQAMSERGLVLAPGVLRGDFAPRDFGLLFGGIGGLSLTQDIPGFRVGRVAVGGGGNFDTDITRLTLGAGAALGVMEDLEVGAMLLPVYLAPDGDFGDIEAYGRYRFLKGDVEVGAQVTVAFPTSTHFGLGFGAPVLFHLGRMRIDTGLELELIFTDPTVVDIDIPAAFTFDLGDGLFAGARTGLYVPDFDDVAIPLWGFVGYTLISGNAPFIDLVATFGWPRFIWTGVGDSVEIDTFDMVLGARFFFTVM